MNPKHRRFSRPFVLAVFCSGGPLLAADLSITKVGPGGVKPGAPIVYTITVTNLDAGDVRDAVVLDPTPPGLTFVSNTGACTTAFPCPLPLLGVGLSATITATFSVPANYAGAPIILNTAIVTSTADTKPANNSATAATARVDGFYTLPPCRVADTRAPGGSPLVAGTARTFNLREVCGLPGNAIAVSYNITVTGATGPGNLRLYAGGTAAPLASALNYAAGQTRANNGIVPLSADGLLAVQCDQAPGTVAHFIIDVNGYFATNDAVPTPKGLKVRVRPAPEVEITFDNVTQAGVTTAKVIEFADNRPVGGGDQNLQDFFPPGSPLRALLPSVIVPSYVKAMGKGGPLGPPTFVLAIIDTTAVFERTAEFHGLEDFLLGWNPPCVSVDRTQEPRTFYAPEALKGEPGLVEETAFGGPVFTDVSSGCGSNKASGWNFSLYLTGRDSRAPLEVARFKLQQLQIALSGFSRFINATVANNLATELQAALGSLDNAPASSLANMTNFVNIVDGNPTAFNNTGRNIAGELVGRALSARYILQKLVSPGA